MSNFVWLLPSFFGDIELQTTGPKTCRVLVKEATTEEQAALATFHQHALKKGWRTSGSAMDPTFEVTAPIETVAKHLAKVLKPGKSLVSAVKFTNGKILEVNESHFPIRVPTPNASASSGSSPSSSPAKFETADPSAAVPSTTPSTPSATPSPDATPAAAAIPVAATTVTQPVRGCPAPDFSPARTRARRVLETFLTAEQVDDFRCFDRFITIGGTTGHRYMVIPRTNRDALARFGGRSIYDLDDRKSICTHNWSIPAEEEVHELNILLTLPGYEAWLRELPEA